MGRPTQEWGRNKGGRSGLGSGVGRLIVEGGLVDAHTLCADEETPFPATHDRGGQKIDFVFLTPPLQNAVKAASIFLPICDGYLSDHRALVVDFDASELFGDKTSPLVAPGQRRLTSTNPRAVILM